MEDMLPLGEEQIEVELLMCDRKNNVLFTDTECLVLSPNFKLPDVSQIRLRVPIKNNMYSVDMKNIVPKESLTCLVAKATLDESMLWHKRLGHINFKNINKLVKDNLVRGLPSKRFENDQTYVACLKGKQHKASCIRRKFSIARTPQQNGVTERRNRTLIEAARTMVLVVKPYNKTPYELFRGRTPALSFMRPFGCHVTILNTLDYLGRFDGKADEGFFVGYSLNSKAFRVYNTRTRKLKENLHVRFLEDKPIIAGDGPKWLFNIDVLRKSMNYVPVLAGTNSNDFVGTEEGIGEDAARKNVQSYTRRKRAVSTRSGGISTASRLFSTAEESVSTVGASMPISTTDAARKNVQSYTRRKRAVSTRSGGISTASRLFSTAEESVSTVGASMPISTTGMVQRVNISIPSPITIKDKGKGKMEESKDKQTKRTKLQSNIQSLIRRFTLKNLENTRRSSGLVELKRLFEPDTNDTLWKLQRYMYDPLTWRLYDTCGVEKGTYIFMMAEKEYPLSKGILTLINGFAPHWIGDNIPNNQNGWIEEDTKEEEEDPEEEEEDLKEEEEDPEEDPMEDDDDVMEMDDEAEVIDPYMDDGSNNLPPLNSKDEETPPTSPIIPDADGQPIPPIASFGQNFHFGESSSTANLLTGNSKIVSTGPTCPNLGTAWKRLGKMEKLMSERIDTEGRMKKKFKEQDRHFVG
nr:ribonuclease H-like domain-containing protein [Tanacetum cinerariifolium]